MQGNLDTAQMCIAAEGRANIPDNHAARSRFCHCIRDIGAERTRLAEIRRLDGDRLGANDISFRIQDVNLQGLLEACQCETLHMSYAAADRSTVLRLEDGDLLRMRWVGHNVLRSAR